MGGDPRLGTHIGKRSAVHARRKRQHRNEQVRRRRLAPGGIDQPDRVAGPVDEHRPARLVMQRGHKIVTCGVHAEQVAVLRVPVLAQVRDRSDIATPRLKQREMRIGPHRGHHRREVGPVIARRHPRPPIREQARQLRIRHPRQTRRGDTPIPDHHPHRRHVTVRAAHRLDDLPITTVLEHQGHDRPEVRHLLPPRRQTATPNASPSPRRPKPRTPRYQLSRTLLPTSRTSATN